MIEFIVLGHPADWTLLPWIETTSFGWRFTWMMIVVIGVKA